MPFPTGHALIIGVGEYQYMSRHNVPVAARDAEAVRAVLQNPSLCGYPSTQVTLLTNAAATRAAILSALDGLAARLDESSTLFLFFVGHGVYGTDGNYYLTTHDTILDGKQVKAGTGVSENELIQKLKNIRAKRLLMIINACHSGQLSPSFDVENDAFSSEAPPQKLAEAALSTGEGRITITACRPEQKSWIGRDKLSIFSGAVVSGLKGDGLPNRNGYISAYGLYEHVYFSAKDAAEELGEIQEPELTVLKGVGPFPVALYHGATKPGDFDISEPVPANTAVREVKVGTSQRTFNAYLDGGGAIAQGDGAVAVGTRSVHIGGNSNGNVIITGDHNQVKGGNL